MVHLYGTLLSLFRYLNVENAIVQLSVRRLSKKFLTITKLQAYPPLGRPPPQKKIHTHFGERGGYKYTHMPSYLQALEEKEGGGACVTEERGAPSSIRGR